MKDRRKKHKSLKKIPESLKKRLKDQNKKNENDACSSFSPFIFMRDLLDSKKPTMACLELFPHSRIPQMSPGSVFFGGNEFVTLAVNVDDFDLIVVLQMLAELGDIHIH